MESVNIILFLDTMESYCEDLSQDKAFQWLILKWEWALIPLQHFIIML
ncbi:hypothetical protein bsdtb5_23920 [Anaeromicropila herbilytica]|uniref:Uncharacterized protein n=1 Tax=Anaeromicropila herbilytica TaxID=2785025 RepID=A0A7R7EM86_9FIRM|nr:hypothetical protein bsdtb5_23920 [Anaeromicropila herbilytica]